VKLSESLDLHIPSTLKIEVVALEDALDAEHLRCQELARMLDDERHGRRNAEAARDEARHAYALVVEAIDPARQSLNYACAADGDREATPEEVVREIGERLCDYKGCRESCCIVSPRQHEEAVAILHLVYSMREYALRGRIANQRRELRMLNAQIAAVESDGMMLRFRDAVAKWQRRAEDAERNLRETSDLANSTIRRLNRRAQAAESRAIKAERAQRTLHVRLMGALKALDDARHKWERGIDTASGPDVTIMSETRAPARKSGGVDLSMIIGSRPIPETALEPTDGGGRQEDAVDVIMISMQSRSFDVAGQHTHLCPKCYRHAPCGLTCSVFHENQRDDGTYEASPSECDDCEHGAEDNAVNVPLIHVYMAIGRAQSQGEHEEARVMSKAFDGRPADERFVRMTRDLAKLVRKHYPDDEDLARRRVTERAKPPHPWRMERRAVVAERCDNAACVCRARRADGASLVANALTLASEAHHAPGDGPLHAEWQDKPHRVVYDLCATVRAQADAIADRDARIADLERRLREAEGQIDSAWNASGVAGTVRGLTTLADVISVQRANGDEARRSAAAHAAAADDYRDAFAQAALERDAAIARAERAEATIARVRGLVDGDDDAWARCVLAILDGGKES
jgi:hypothetical protein